MAARRKPSKAKAKKAATRSRVAKKKAPKAARKAAPAPKRTARRLRSLPVYEAISPPELARLMARWGLPAEIDSHDGEHGLITSAIDDQPFFIAFVGEQPEGSHRYGMIELRTYFSFEGGVPGGLSNAINQNFVSAKASVDEEGDLAVQQSVLVHGGVTEASLALNFGIWKETIEEIVSGLELA
jgi:hypothetical protein